MKTIGTIKISSGDSKNPGSAACCCSPESTKEKALSVKSENAVDMIIGVKGTPAGDAIVVSTVRSRADIWNGFKSRISSFRMSYTVKPGLYAVGNPDENSDVMVSANYKLSFDALRTKLMGINAWILVIDTDGINVWCAAGKGTFGTEELAKRIMLHGIGSVVAHRRIIVPQLGAPGVNAEDIKERTGFRVFFGPVRAEDLPAYLKAGYRATPEMRRVNFSFGDRLVLTPMELIPAMKFFIPIALIILIIFGIDASGILFNKALVEGGPMAGLALASTLSGAFITPVMLPFIPFRSFAIKGLISGLIVTALLVHGADLLPNGSLLLVALSYVLFPAFSSFLALQFTGASTYTSRSGVAKELRFSIPLYIAAGAVSVILIIMYKLVGWGML